MSEMQTMTEQKLCSFTVPQLELSNTCLIDAGYAGEDENGYFLNFEKMGKRDAD